MSEQIFYTVDGLAVKTLFVSFLRIDLNRDHLYDYFSTFGPVHSVWIHVYATHSIGFVKFEGAASAASALKMKHHEIDGCEIEVKIADSHHQNDEFRIELTNATGTQFMDLNDDCLRQILTNTTVMDLCSLLELSEMSENVRLEAITNETFVRKHKSFELNTVDEVERVLTGFGPLLSQFSSDGSSHSPRKIKLLIEHCSGTLKSLRLTKYTFDENEIRAIKPLFASLQKIVIDGCHFGGNDTADLFASCQSLESLGVFDCTLDENAILQQTFNLLTVFKSYGFINRFGFENFISRQKKLKVLEIYNRKTHAEILPVLARNCSELSELSFCTRGNIKPIQYENYVKSVTSLKNLKMLTIALDQRPLIFIQQLNYLQSLKELHLLWIRFTPGTLAALSQVQTLNILQIFNCRDFIDFNPLTQLHRLKELLISSNEDVTFDLDYIVSRLLELKRLMFKVKKNIVKEHEHVEIVNCPSKLGSGKRIEILCNDNRIQQSIKIF